MNLVMDKVFLHLIWFKPFAHSNQKGSVVIPQSSRKWQLMAICTMILATNGAQINGLISIEIDGW